MTLPKGYKKGYTNSSSRRRAINKPKLVMGIISFIFFIIGLIIIYHNFVVYVETGKEIEHEKQVLEDMKRDLGGYYSSN